MFEFGHNRGTAIVDEIIRFSLNALGSSAVIFSWSECLDGNLSWSSSETAAIGLNDNFLKQYVLDKIDAVDPLNISAVVSNGYRVRRFSNLGHSGGNCAGFARYSRFMESHGVSDEVDFVLWDDGLPVAALGIFKRGDARFAGMGVQWDAIQRFLEQHLKFHPRVANLREARELRRFGLTSREIEVARLIRAGASNAAIAGELRISLATAKTHVTNILSKLGVRNRTQIGAFAGDPCT